MLGVTVDDRPYIGLIALVGAACAAALWIAPMAALALVPMAAGLVVLVLRPTLTVPVVGGLLLVSDGIDFGITVGVHLTVGKLGMLLVIVAWSVHCLAARRAPLILNRLWLPHILLFTVLVSGLARSRYLDATTFMIVFGFLLLTVMVQVVVASVDPWHLRGALLAFVVVYAAVVAVSLVYGEEVDGGQFMRNAGFGGNPNAWSTIVLLGLGPAVAVCDNQRSWAWRLAVPVVLVLAVMGVLSTVSRSGLLVMAAVSPFLLVILWRRKALLMGAAAIALVVAPAVTDFGSVSERLDSFVDEEEREMDGSLRERAIVVAYAWEIFQDYPLFGVGTGSFRREVEAASSGHVHHSSHNTYMGTLAEQGIVGLTAYLVFLGFMLYFALVAYLRQPAPAFRRVSVGLGSSIVVFVLFGGTNDVIYLSIAHFFFALLYVWYSLSALPVEELEEMGLA